MYTNYIENLKKQKDRIDELISAYQQPQPVNNFINTQIPNKDLIEWRILNENEEVDNLYVKNKTLFINDNLMVLKDVNGGLQKWKVQKIFPIDKKDEKISQLEDEIKKLKEVLNEYTKSNESTSKRNKSTTNDDGDANRKSETSSESVSE